MRYDKLWGSLYYNTESWSKLAVLWNIFFYTEYFGLLIGGSIKVWYFPIYRYTNGIGTLSPLILEYSRLQSLITGKVFTQYTLVTISMFFLKYLRIKFEYIMIKVVSKNRNDYRNIFHTLSIIANSCIGTRYTQRNWQEIAIIFFILTWELQYASTSNIMALVFLSDSYNFNIFNSNLWKNGVSNMTRFTHYDWNRRIL